MRFLTILFLIFSACGSPRKEAVSINLGNEPYSLDPRKARDLQSQTLSKMFFEGLTRINAQDEAELALAEKVDVSSDGREYTFHLRHAKWSNGDKVTAPDFVYAWKKVLDPKFPSDQAFQLYVVKNGKAAKIGECSLGEVGVAALDDLTLHVTLEGAVPYFLELVAMPAFFPIHRETDIAQPNWALQADSFVCNGPFFLQQWVHASEILAAKNPHYWDASNVKLQQIHLVMVSEETELKMYEKKELDWAGSPFSTLPIDALGSLKKKEALHSKPFLGTYFFRVNVEKAPLDHPLMRKALALAIDRKEIIEGVGQMVATALVPPVLKTKERAYFPDGDKTLAQVCFQEALKEMDLSTPPTISLIYASTERNRLIAQAVQAQWHKTLGINVQLQALENKVYFDRISKKDYDIAAGSWIADFKDPINFLEVFKYRTSGSNNTLWENRRYTALLDQVYQAKDGAERSLLLQMCEAILMEEMPIIPVFHYNMLYVMNESMQDVVLTSLGNIDFKRAYKK